MRFGLVMRSFACVSLFGLLFKLPLTLGLLKYVRDQSGFSFSCLFYICREVRGAVYI